MDEAYYNKHFDIHTLPGKNGRPDRHFVVHRLCTIHSLSHLRNDRRTFQSLQENNVFLRRHYFKEDEWNTVSLGFLLYFDPSKHLRDDAKHRILSLANDQDCDMHENGTRFKLVPGTPFLYVKGQCYPTKAYTVMCL